jgi:tetratricopeptide (TPR) repeat protein
MPRLTPDQIRIAFSSSQEFNELFDAFEDALAQELKDLELYRLLFWNPALGPDELCMFGDKLARTFSDISYEIYMWLANIFEVTYSSYDNFELAIAYYRKAASSRPLDADPYLNAADCYEPDLNIPPADVLIGFLKDGLKCVENKKVVLQRLSYLYQMIGDREQSDYYRSLADDLGKYQN